MQISELTTHAQHILREAPAHDQYAVQQASVALFWQFIFEAGGKDAIDLIDKARKIAKK